MVIIMNFVKKTMLTAALAAGLAAGSPADAQTSGADISGHIILNNSRISRNYSSFIPGNSGRWYPRYPRGGGTNIYVIPRSGGYYAPELYAPFGIVPYYDVPYPMYDSRERKLEKQLGKAEKKIEKMKEEKKDKELDALEGEIKSLKKREQEEKARNRRMTDKEVLDAVYNSLTETGVFESIGRNEAVYSKDPTYQNKLYLGEIDIFCHDEETGTYIAVEIADYNRVRGNINGSSAKERVYLINVPGDATDWTPLRIGEYVRDQLGRAGILEGTMVE